MYQAFEVNNRKETALIHENTKLKKIIGNLTKELKKPKTVVVTMTLA